ncbi:VOC family protein [Marixanthomonas ophiurae]|uniref:Glyoxalase/bleomycin resistance/extradiol dioxygenase family protein n=1 Tax=Marixanthomonas ophiurae TaxID=387659 RepID=A0A3E1QCQ8_9FLAO|nr:VOC family protein [Marixanthomonas ophiurae]RFN59939.1 glyoxalase/bleomycin resistance/extradiol dioxygenase family protein [Marixanthomonas ophiurae]
MKPKMIWANVGVEDIERTQEFYLALGFKLNGNPTKELVSFIFSETGFVIHFFEKKRLQESIEGELTDTTAGNEMMFSLSIASKKEYDSWVTEIKNAGGKIFFDSNINRKKIYDENGYYVCVFADPDGHKFNLLFNSNT